MKIFDEVKVLNNYYNENQVYEGMVGTIWSGEIRDNCFLVLFVDERFQDKNYLWTDENVKLAKDDITIPIKIEDLEVVKEGYADDKMILENLPKQNPRWWCKVEDGYIKNLLGEKKNKIPYDYKS